jgi:glycosyltransferase involved in cell wall biosynthesis
MHLPFLFRGLYISENKSKLSLTYLVHKYIELTTVRLMKKYMKILLNQGQFCGAFAAHHTYDLNLISNNNICIYVHTPTPDPFNEIKINKSKNEKFKIMHIGHLKGIATLYGVRDIAYNILPILDKNIGPDNYEFHIVGGFFDELDLDIKNILKSHRSVIIRGQVSPSDIEFVTSDLLIVPTSIELGIRVRIITAFSFGLTVVAHKANQKGIPELENGFNCILGESPNELAHGIIKLFHDHDLIKSISVESRNTYEKYFSLNAVGNHFQSIMNEIKNK